MIPTELQKQIIFSLTKILGKSVIITKTQLLGGGSINNTYKINTNQGNFFLKWNDADKYPGMFETEAKGLELLKKTSTLKVPEVYSSGKTYNYSFIILEFLESASQEKNYWDLFGSGLAALHQHTQSYFGLDHDNYIGSIPQSNKKYNDWISFFIIERIETMIKTARNKGLLNLSHIRSFEKLFKLLPEIIPSEPPALLHGDLWSGNYITGPDGKACLIDPAVYYGHREMDLAMSKLFGGFDKQFYEAYQANFPLENGWEKRMDYCNLYPLMVHVNLFGGSYIDSVVRILNRFK